MAGASRGCPGNKCDRHLRRRRDAGSLRRGAAGGLRLRGLPRPAGGHRHPCERRWRRAGAHAHRRRQEPVLPDPGHRAPARGTRRGHRGLAADRADARPGGRPARSGRGRGLPQLQSHAGRGAADRAPPADRGHHPALRRSRAADHAAPPGLARLAARTRPALAFCHRRGALREPVGSRLPPRIPRTGAAARALRGCAPHCAHGHGRRAHARGHRHPPAAAGRAPVCQQLRPAQYPLHHRREEGQHPAAAALHPRRAHQRHG